MSRVLRKLNLLRPQSSMQEQTEYEQLMIKKKRSTDFLKKKKKKK